MSYRNYSYGALFEDRVEAGRLLAEELESLRGESPLVLGIPRGGLVVGHEIAKALDTELDVVVARKLGAPGNPELAIGAVMESGQMHINNDLIRELGVSKAYIEVEKQRQLEEIRNRLEKYRKVRPKATVKGRYVILTDDGMASGATMFTAVEGTKAERPKSIVVAVPVGPALTIAELKAAVRDVVCLATPELFAAVGQFYRNFDQTTNEEVLQILEQYSGVSRDRSEG